MVKNPHLWSFTVFPEDKYSEKTMKHNKNGIRLF